MSDEGFGPGGLYDARDMAKHFFYESKRQGRRNDMAQLAMGVSTIGVGSFMAWDAVKHLFFSKGHGGGRGV